MQTKEMKIRLPLNVHRELLRAANAAHRSMTQQVIHLVTVGLLADGKRRGESA
jgi:hypothetical protein